MAGAVEDAIIVDGQEVVDWVSGTFVQQVYFVLRCQCRKGEQEYADM